MSKSIFDDFVSKNISQQRQDGIDWLSIRNEWLRQLEIFYTQVEIYLNEYVSSGKISITYGVKKIIEDKIGEYEAKNVMIVIGKIQVMLDPIGANLIGARGRVDMNGLKRKVKFVLVDADSTSPKITSRVYIRGENAPPKSEEPKKVTMVWKIATRPPKIEYIDFTQVAFYEALMSVANG